MFSAEPVSKKTIIWVLGAGGMLGSAIVRSASQIQSFHIYPSPKIPWGDLHRVNEVVSSGFDSLVRRSIEEGAHWAVVWAAGPGIVGAHQSVLDSEVLQFENILTIFQQRIESDPVINRGTLFFSSSAGGVYGGSGTGPFTESTLPNPISPYGEARLEMERKAAYFGQNTKTKIIIGRIANLYGPGQDLAKPQGLITQLARSQFSPRPVSIFVPLDTRRDYIYVDDCAQLVLDCICEVQRDLLDHSAAIKILCSGKSTTISSLLGKMKVITKRRANVLIGSSPLKKQQAPDLTLRSEKWTHLIAGRKTPLDVGIGNTVRDVIRRLQIGTDT